MKLKIACLLTLSVASYSTPKKSTLPKKNNTQTVFTQIFIDRLWPDSESVSGGGSNLAETKVIRKEIPLILKSLQAKTFLDASCGDFNWMKQVNLDFLDSYIGFDIVANIIAQNQIKYANDKRIFMHKNIITDPIPQVDVILCRDALVHLSIKDIYTTIKNFKRSKSKYLLMTTFTKVRASNDTQNMDIQTGQWRPLNFSLAPFNFPQPLLLVKEGCTQTGYSDKCLALWKLDELQV